MVQWFKTLQRIWVWSLVGQLRFHMPWGQKNTTTTIKQEQYCKKFNKDFTKMVHIKRKKNLKNSYENIDQEDLSYFNRASWKRCHCMWLWRCLEAEQIKQEQVETAFQVREKMCKGPVAGKVRGVGGIERRPVDWRPENKGKQMNKTEGWEGKRPWPYSPRWIQTVP